MTESRFVLDTNAVIVLAAGDNVTAFALENELKAAACVRGCPPATFFLFT